MKNTTLFFICFQLLNIITTKIGLDLGLKESNPLWTTVDLITIKLILVTGCVFIIQYIKHFWMIWIPILISAAAVMWNCLNILVIIS